MKVWVSWSRIHLSRPLASFSQRWATLSNRVSADRHRRAALARGRFEGPSQGPLGRPGLAVALALAVLGLAREGEAATITLNPAVRPDCTLYRAVEAINLGRNTAQCPVSSGTYGVQDKISIPAGTFKFGLTLDIKKSVEIAGLGTSNTFITPSSPSLDTAIRISSPTVKLKLTGVDLYGPPSNTTNGIFVSTGGQSAPEPGNVEIRSSNVRGFTRSGIIISGGGTVYAHSCGLHQNSAPFFGGAVHMVGSKGTFTRFQAVSTAIGNNRATYGGGIYNQDGNVELDAMSFFGNFADGAGGALYGSFNNLANGAYLNVKNDSGTSRFNNNGAAAGGASIVDGNLVTTFASGTLASGNTLPRCEPTIVPNGCPPN